MTCSRERLLSHRLVRRAILLLVVAGTIAGVFVLALVPPSDDTFYPRCQFHMLTGLHCPGCGTTRAFHALFTGRVEQALAYNTLAFLILPVVGWSMARSVWAWYIGRPVPDSSRLAARWLWVLAAVMVVFGVLRNLPWYPFTELAPHEITTPAER